MKTIKAILNYLKYELAHTKDSDTKRRVRVMISIIEQFAEN